MELSVQNVYGLILRSKLLSIDDARAMFNRWNAEVKDQAADVPRFLKWLVANHYVTEYQANLLNRGHADGFFLNQYKILDRLGKGRMAGVYKAAHELGQVVAIKVLPPSRAKEPAFLARFQREARLACRLKHPNIVRSFQVAEAEGLYYFVMEHLEGETLDEVLHRRGKLPPPEAVRLIYQALLGLQHIHEQGLVHRDLKPSNLMLVPAPTPGPGENTLRCTVKILDIGLGRSVFEEEGEKPKDAGLTAEGMLLGTPDYMAPEQARDARHIDIRADIYSLGCVLYHTLAGRPPFPDTNIVSQMIRHATEQPRPLKDFNPAVPDGLQQIVSWMMMKDPNQRYPTPARAAQALQVFLAAGAEAAQAEPDARMRSYLTWLEMDINREEAKARGVSQAPVKPAPAAIPPTVVTPLAPGAKPSAEKKPREKTGLKRRAKRHKKPAVAGAPGQQPVSKAPRDPKAIQEQRAARAQAKAKARAEKLARLSQQFDVELVAHPTTLPQPAPTPVQRPITAIGGFQLTQRDLSLLAVGGGSVPVAIFLGFWLANIGGMELSLRDYLFFAVGAAFILLGVPVFFAVKPYVAPAFCWAQSLLGRLWTNSRALSKNLLKKKPRPPAPPAPPAAVPAGSPPVAVPVVATVAAPVPTAQPVQPKKP